jgi:hypothetical protein
LALVRLLVGIAFVADAGRAQDTEQVRALGERVAEALSSLERYDSDITVHSGLWMSQFVHLRLDGAEAPEVILLSFDPRLLSQVADHLKSSNPGRPGAVEFREYRAPIERCKGLSAKIDDFKIALRESIATVGQRSTTPPADEIVVDGRHYALKIRINRYFAGTFGVGENDERLFPPLDALVRAVGDCSNGAASRFRSHDF